ncbi:MAG: hypothetical protein NZM31_00170 [Gemmatales bacterium]|nr:hypothetical protein [Gemmatales bacterium]MDW8385407.1 hypothetical protein [Gemmatales bacterium]
MRSGKTNYRRISPWLAVLGLFGCLGPPSVVAVQVEDAPGSENPLRANVVSLIRALDRLGCPLPDKVIQELSARSVDAESRRDYREKVERLLAPWCLIEVSINPESRVKAARGPASARLSQGQPTCFIVKVHNEAGVTQALAVTGPHLRTAGDNAQGWLDAEIRHLLSDRLSGQETEYVVLCVRTGQSGKREATLVFDVGQGSQDLGFRAEVPILFTIHPAPGGQPLPHHAP